MVLIDIIDNHDKMFILIVKVLRQGVQYTIYCTRYT